MSFIRNFARIRTVCCETSYFIKRGGGGKGGGSRHEITKIIFRFHESRKTKFHFHEF